MPKGVIAVVGRPNVGKSTFLNKISGRRISIVDDTPGVTRDRITCEVTWNGRTATVIDTGGIEPRANTPLLKMMREQAQVAITHADVIIFMCELATGVTASDRDIANMLKRSRKPVIPVVNKVDTVGSLPAGYYEFYELGFETDPIPVSSQSGSGTGDVLDAAFSMLPPDDGEDEPSPGIRVAVIGKPNAGKSSLINRLSGEDRVIVSDIPGTTRDAVDTEVVHGADRYTFIDTAGIRRNARIEDDIEKYSVLRARMAVERADVCLLMVDAAEGVTAQDERIAGIAHESGKSVIIVINKWDTVDKDNGTVNAFRQRVYEALSYMTYAPLVFISVKTGQRVDRLFTMINEVYANACRRINTGTINDMLNDAVTRVQPPTDKGRRLKIYYMTQTGVNPPTFVLFVNSAQLFHFSYQRYIENCLRDSFDFTGTPIRLVIKQKGESGDIPR